MWLFTQGGFYSVVAYDPSKDLSGKSLEGNLLLVRARVRGDLDRLRRWIPDLEIRETKRADYRFRTQVSRNDWKRVLEDEVDALNYTNFKNRVAEKQGHDRHDAYVSVWTAVRRLQP